MGSRLVIILDDLLWVLTDSQLKAALHFIDSLGGLIEKATILERKTKAARKLEVRVRFLSLLHQYIINQYSMNFFPYNLRFYQNIKLRYLNKAERRINIIQQYRRYLRDTML